MGYVFRSWVNALTGPLALLTWAVAVLSGMLGLSRYQMTPGAQIASSNWPASVHISRDPKRLTLVMALHPQCPCSRASVHELDVLMAHAGGHLAARVIFVRPQGAPANWLDTDLWKAASSIPGVSVAADPNGADAAAFHAVTSGQVDLFDPSGRSLFAGGITDGRGHEGDNAGLNAILSILRDGKSSIASTAVFGCPLGTPGTCKQGDSW